MPTKLTASKFLALIRELHTPHLYILRGDLKIPADAHLLKVLNQEIQSREETDMPQCDRCLPNILIDSVGFIPIGEGGKRINVCQRHMEQAREMCYLVLRNGQNENSASSDFDRRTWEKHERLRGSRELKRDFVRKYQAEAA